LSCLDVEMRIVRHMDPIGEVAHDPIMHILQPGERIELALEGMESEIRVTDRRIVVTQDQRVRLDIPFERLRRIQFDVESGRPAVMVVVPTM
jgi:hypothetical protein